MKCKECGNKLTKKDIAHFKELMGELLDDDDVSCEKCIEDGVKEMEED